MTTLLLSLASHPTVIATDGALSDFQGWGVRIG